MKVHFLVIAKYHDNSRNVWLCFDNGPAIHNVYITLKEAKKIIKSLQLILTDESKDELGHYQYFNIKQ